MTLAGSVTARPTLVAGAERRLQDSYVHTLSASRALAAAHGSFFACSLRPPPNPYRGEPDTQVSQMHPHSCPLHPTIRASGASARCSISRTVYRTLLDTAPLRAPDLPIPTPPPVSATPLVHAPSCCGDGRAFSLSSPALPS